MNIGYVVMSNRDRVHALRDDGRTACGQEIRTATYIERWADVPDDIPKCGNCYSVPRPEVRTGHDFGQVATCSTTLEGRVNA